MHSLLHECLAWFFGLKKTAFALFPEKMTDWRDIFRKTKKFLTFVPGKPMFVNEVKAEEAIFLSSSFRTDDICQWNSCPESYFF